MSQQFRSVLDLPVFAVGAITQYRAVGLVASTLNGAYAASQATVASQKVIGIARRSAADGAMVDVTAIGTAICEAGGVIGLGVRVAVDTSGRVVAASQLAIAAGATAVTSAAANGTTDLSGGDTPQFVFGMAMQASTGAGDLIEVLICP